MTLAISDTTSALLLAYHLEKKDSSSASSPPGEEGAHLVRKASPSAPAEGTHLVRKTASSAPSDVDILVNQAFYLPGYSKVALVRANSEIAAGKFKLTETSSNKTVHEGALKRYGTYARWGNEFYYFADFSSLNKEGTYKLTAEWPGHQASAAVVIKKSELSRATGNAAGFFYFQRCGAAIPGWHGPCHTNDPEGTAGGWHDAGDYNKYIYTQWQPAWALLDLYQKTKDRKYLAEAKWGEDFLAKMVRPDGSMWSAVFGGWDWTRPEQGNTRELTSAQWGDPTWAVAANSATFAKMAAYTSGTEHEKFLRLAKQTNQYFRQHFRFGHIPRGEDLQGLGGIVLSDLLLHEQTGDGSYLADAEKNVRLILAHQDRRGFFFTDSNRQEPFWDDYMTYFFVEALGDYARRFPRRELTGQIKAALRNLADNQLKFLSSRTPFRQMQMLDPLDQHPPNGEVFENFFDKKIEGWIRGANSYYLSSANAAMIAYSLLGKPEYKEIAINQLNWVLGVNPYGISFMEGSCVRCTKNGHHRYDTLPGHANGIVPGGITNGLASNNGEDYFYDALGKTWASNETWLPHNAWFIMLGLKLSAYLDEAAAASSLTVNSDSANAEKKPPAAPEPVVISASGLLPNITFQSVVRNGTLKENGDSIGVDIRFRFTNIPPAVVSLKGNIYTSGIWPQGEVKVERGKSDYIFKAFLYKLNRFSGFFIQGFDRTGKRIFQSDSFPIELPPKK